MERIGRIQLWRKIGGDSIEKGAELANTYDMPMSVSPQNKEPNKGGEKAVIRKVASIGHLVKQETKPDSDLVAFLEGKDKEVEEGVPGETPKALPQMGKISPHVDVSTFEPPKLVQEKKASHYALPDRELYPLDSYVHVKTASRYFMENYKFMAPEDRHEYCSNLVKRASDLNLFTDSLIEKYGSAGYAHPDSIDACISARREAIQNEDHIGILDKLAHVREVVDPDVFAEALERFDKAAGLFHRYGDTLPDAYYSTFGKTAAELAEKTDPKDSIVIGNEYITRRKLAEFLQNNVGSIRERFGADFAKEIADSPNDIFDSLPRDQKLVIMRLANSDAPIQNTVQPV